MTASFPNNQTTAYEVAFQEWCDENRRPQTLPSSEEPAWLIRYEDQDIGCELFTGEGAEISARRRFEQQRGSWSISLFQEVARA
jgi:hypothetical protein